MRKHRPLKQMSAVDSNTLKLETDMSPNTILHYEKAKKSLDKEKRGDYSAIITSAQRPMLQQCRRQRKSIRYVTA
jgi:hypothetical protein